MKSDKSKNGRRDFLKGAAITAAAATVAATVSKTACEDLLRNCKILINFF